jgi:hypothetical protein
VALPELEAHSQQAWKGDNPGLQAAINNYDRVLQAMGRTEEEILVQ